MSCPEGHLFQDVQNLAHYEDSSEFPGQKETDVVAFADPRTSFNGVRLLCGKGSFSVEEQEGVKKGDGERDYEVFRHTLGILEGSKECGG